jgi:hypothetical protein
LIHYTDASSGSGVDNVKVTFFTDLEPLALVVLLVVVVALPHATTDTISTIINNNDKIFFIFVSPPDFDVDGNAFYILKKEKIV